MNQESLAECLFTSKWYNPFPKFKYTERPDTAAAQILEGNIIILVDNSPSAMILPISILDMIQEADDFYFPPLTGSYLRLSRFLILILTYFITPTFLLLMQNPDWIPPAFDFIVVKEDINVPLIWQFLILELAIDGLRLAAVNTPNMLSTPLSVMAALILGEFSVKSGWFNAEVMHNAIKPYKIKASKPITYIFTPVLHQIPNQPIPLITLKNSSLTKSSSTDIYTFSVVL